MKNDLALFISALILVNMLMGSTNIYVQSKGCGYAALRKIKHHNSQLDKPLDDDSRNLSSDLYEPIRIHLDFSHIERDLGKFKKKDLEALKNYIMPKTKEIFEKLINVKRLKSKLKFNTKSCDDYTIPEDLTQTGTGVEADLVIFVTIDDSGYFLENEIEAAAIHCIQHTETRRPTAGYIQFKPDLDMTDTTALDYLVWLAVHETTHILVMNDGLYGDYVDKSYRKVGLSSILEKVSHPISGKQIHIIKSPKVLQKAREHFGCDNLEGVALEYNGGPGTAGAHWSKKMMNTDYMIGDSYGENLISDITLALFEDSGWYAVDYNLSNLFLWGKNKGCSFYQRKCVSELSSRESSKSKINNRTSYSDLQINGHHNHNIHQDSGFYITSNGLLRRRGVEKFFNSIAREKKIDIMALKKRSTSDIKNIFDKSVDNNKNRFKSNSSNIQNSQYKLNKKRISLKHNDPTQSESDFRFVQKNNKNDHNRKKKKSKNQSLGDGVYYNRIDSRFPEEFCNNPNKDICSRHHIFRGNCAMKKFSSPLPEYERYFTDQYLGGVDSLTDKCPISIEMKRGQYYYGGSCRKGVKNYDIEEICPECACFISSIKKTDTRKSNLKSSNSNSNNSATKNNTESHLQSSKKEINEKDLVNYNDMSEYMDELYQKTPPHYRVSNNNNYGSENSEDDYKAMCFKFICDSSGKLSVVVNDKAFICQSGGTKIEGYNGTIICPDEKILCNEKFKCKFGCTERYSNSIPYKVLRKRS